MTDFGSYTCMEPTFEDLTLKAEIRHDGIYCCHRWRRRLSSRQPTVPPMTTNLASWQISVSEYRTGISGRSKIWQNNNRCLLCHSFPVQDIGASRISRNGWSIVSDPRNLSLGNPVSMNYGCRDRWINWNNQAFVLPLIDSPFGESQHSAHNSSSNHTTGGYH